MGVAGGVVIGFVVVAVAAVLSGAALLARWSPFGEEQVDRSAPVVLQQLRDLSRYTAATGEFSELVDVETDVGVLPSFVAGERTVLVAVGSVDAEVDFSRLGGEYVTVSEDGRRVEVHLPPAELSEPRLDHERTHVAARSRGVIDRVSDALGSGARDDQVLYRLAGERIAVAAEATELRERAEENTRVMLTGLLGGLGYEEVVVAFDAPVP